MTIVPAEGPILDEILSASFELWHEGLSREAYPRFYKGQLGTAWARTNLSRWALVDGGDVLASAKTYAFDAVLDGREVRALGLGAVFTQPRHRGHGHARVLIDRMLARATADGFDLALLFSEIGADYYARLGFTPIPTVDLDLRVREDSRRGAPATLVRFGDERDLADLASMGDTRASPFRFRLRRTRGLLQYAIAKKRLLAGLSKPGARGVEFFVAEEGNSAVAYALISTHGLMWVVEEAGDRDPSGARLGAILQALIARDPAAPRPTIIAWLPAGLRPPQVDIIREQPAHDVMMIKPLSANGTSPPLAADDVFYWRSDLF